MDGPSYRTAKNITHLLKLVKARIKKAWSSQSSTTFPQLLPGV